jgi:hypothetical protein
MIRAKFAEISAYLTCAAGLPVYHLQYPLQSIHQEEFFVLLSSNCRESKLDSRLSAINVPISQD